MLQVVGLLGVLFAVILVPSGRQIIENSWNEKRLVWYWCDIGGKIAINKYEAKILQLTGLLKGRAQAHVVAVSVPVNGDIQQSRNFMQSIVNDLMMPLERLESVGSK